MKLAKIGIGDRAPDFTLEDQHGRPISLHDYAGAKNVVVYFYPKDFTPGCTAETRSFSTVYGQLRGMGTEVLGISTGTVRSHKEFAEACGASFPLLADTGGRVRELYGIQPSMWLIPGRTSFVIDKQGVVRSMYTSQTNAAGHVAEALKTLKSLPG